ncbi:conserved Plasmodium protein, unknown function [Plasmodium berghei]|uniref:Uncharacterized protein n=2 Tax=Plasmodium berghei TaxID=5821 RepID=A0A509AFP7_PLABA|nr:conserved Plasmodium protein, unknown function [Plasmodium berghei ANKA]SCL92186.1 conserved Plasmodium protein, unknown function [Plasmodium berghei]SCM15611.1 conserved Plasmodium protein, unknown function [Plasmodium berghei]SCM17403.1 conserved Plasmodium protein, unknown function [Plasmodium berghei]SCN22680.1 conserved Plasmodium protein, unknown function [Plasmodium berghei]VUC54376.1 conserved Plasmodium protein, unknown function [Plasmodium berghei ANKA]|eukprot:XP_034420209.1 conserved Plasmodium protein, unknown function [Plasmodium berghei ANKA]
MKISVYFFPLFFILIINISKSKITGNNLVSGVNNIYCSNELKDKCVINRWPKGIKEYRRVDKNCKRNKYLLFNISNGKIKNIFTFKNSIRQIKDKIKYMFKRNQTVLDKLKNLNKKKNIWFIEGYAKNVFNPDSFFNVIGLEEVEEIDMKSCDIIKKIDFNKLLNKKYVYKNQKDIKSNYRIVSIQRVKRFALLYKKCCNNCHNYNSICDNKRNNMDDVIKNCTCISNMKKSYVICVYTYVVFSIHDIKENKYYMVINSLNNDDEGIFYELKELNTENTKPSLKSYTPNKGAVKSSNVISLTKKNYILKDVRNNAEQNNKKSNFLSFNIFNTYSKNLFNLVNNFEGILKKIFFSGNELQPEIFILYEDKNIFLKKKSYLEYIKLFFLKSDEYADLYQNIFKNNKWYKLYIQNYAQRQSSYILRCTTINEKKFRNLLKFVKNENNNNYNYHNNYSNDERIFFSYCKILFEKYDEECLKAKHKTKSVINSDENYNHKSVYINIDTNNHLRNKELLILKKQKDTFLFSMAKYLINNLISSIHI